MVIGISVEGRVTIMLLMKALPMPCVIDHLLVVGQRPLAGLEAGSSSASHQPVWVIAWPGPKRSAHEETQRGHRPEEADEDDRDAQRQAVHQPWPPGRCAARSRP